MTMDEYYHESNYHKLKSNKSIIQVSGYFKGVTN